MTRIIDGTPVNYSLTVSPTNGEPEPTEAQVRKQAEDYLASHGKEHMEVVRVEGRYAYYRPQRVPGLTEPRSTENA